MWNTETHASKEVAIPASRHANILPFTLQRSNIGALAHKTKSNPTQFLETGTGIIEHDDDSIVHAMDSW